MARRVRKVRPQGAARAHTAVRALAVSPADVARLASRWPWVRQCALARAANADPLASDRRCLELIIESLTSPWTRNAARRALVAWLPFGPDRGGPRLAEPYLAILRRAARHSLPYRHAAFVIAALNALARLDDVEARSVAEHFIADAVEAPRGAAKPLEPWGGFPETYRGSFPQASPPDLADTFRRVRHAAAACLARLDRAQERQRLRGRLVSPADAPTDGLLRPAECGAPLDDPNLVRPAPPPET